MSLIEKWKNRETKKKLREENIRLKAKIESYMRAPCQVSVDRRDIQKVGSKILVKKEAPNEFVKQDLLRLLCDGLSDYVEYDFFDSLEYEGIMVCTATLYVATGDKRYES